MKMTTARARLIGALLSFPNGDIRAADVVARADLPSGTAYPLLNALVDQGDLAEIIFPGSTRKTTYRLDENGRRTLQRHMDEFILKTPGLKFTPVKDDLDDFIEEQMQDEVFRSAYLAAEASNGALRKGVDADKEAICALKAAVTKLEKRVDRWRAEALASERELEEYRRRFGPLSEGAT